MTGNDLRRIARSAISGPLMTREIEGVLQAADQLDALRSALLVSEEAKIRCQREIARLLDEGAACDG